MLTLFASGYDNLPRGKAFLPAYGESAISLLRQSHKLNKPYREIWLCQPLHSLCNKPPASTWQKTASLNLADLEVGDIIATSADTKNSRTIRWATNSQFSHVMLYAGHGRVIEALPGAGVVRKPLSESLVGTGLAKIFRHKTATESQRQLAVGWAATQIGKPYDYSGAVRVGLQPGSRTRIMNYTTLGFIVIVKDGYSASRAEHGHDESFFCSELIARAYQVAGAPFIDQSPSVVGPGALIVSNQLVLSGRLNVRV